MDQRDPTKKAFHDACNDDRLWILTCQGARAKLDRWGVRVRVQFYGLKISKFFSYLFADHLCTSPRLLLISSYFSSQVTPYHFHFTQITTQQSGNKTESDGIQNDWHAGWKSVEDSRLTNTVYRAYNPVDNV